MTIIKKSASLFIALAWIGCSTAVEKGAVTKNLNAESGAAYNLILSWTAQTDASSYHIFYVDPKNSVREIDLLPESDANFAAPKIAIDSTNMESWPAKGQKACFYVTAENGDLKSDPSASACVVL